MEADVSRPDRFEKEILAFLTRKVLARIGALKEKLRKTSQEKRAAANKEYGAQVRLAELAEEKGLIEKEMLREKNFAEWFEAIMNMKGVRKISVVPSKLVVHTKRIFQHVGSKNRYYDIGQYDIHLSFGLAGFFGRNDIGFTKGDYPGKFLHPQAKDRNTCFGVENRPGGLNESIDKLMAGFVIVELVHLLLSFLREDDEEPVPLTLAKDDYHPSVDEGYKSEEERQSEKTAFVELCRKVSLRKTTALLSAEMESARLEADRMSEEFLKSRNAEEEISLAIAALELRVGDRLPEQAKQETGWFAADEQVADVKCGAENLTISFTRGGLPLALEISPGREPRVLVQSGEAPLGPLFTRSGHMKLLKEKTDFGKAERKRVARLQAEGRVSEIFKFFVGMLERSWNEALKGGGEK